MGVKLFVGNLSYQITELELREAFAQEGRNVQSVRIALDRETQRPRGFAFIEMATEADADGAIKQWNGQLLSGRAVFVEKAQERKPGERPPPRAPEAKSSRADDSSWAASASRSRHGTRWRRDRSP